MAPQPVSEQDIEAATKIAASVAELVRAIHRNEAPERIVGLVALMLNTMIESRDAVTERPSDAPLRAAVRALGRL